jgi:penicillin-binding protein 2
MTFSRIWACSLVLSVFGVGAGVAAALDAPRTLHHARSTESHLTEPHRTTSHHATTHAAMPLPTSLPALMRERLTAAPLMQRRPETQRIGPQEATREPAHAAQPLPRRHHHSYERFTASSFAKGDIFAGDVTAGEDPVVRQAAIDAMGDMNGTAVVINPANGRILAMVNQKLALSPGAEPCSTIKLTVALAALSEGLVTRDTPVKLAGFRMNMTQALAKSNNLYFEELGRELGFERVHQYANQFGLGELAGYNIEGEQLGVYPDEELPASQGGVGRMCSFGQGVSLTPLQLGAFVAALANGGTLYYLQHPDDA